MLGLGGYLTTVTMGMGLILSKITDLTYFQALLVVWVGYTAFTFYAGSQGVVITDTIMFLFFSVVGFVALSFILGNSGGWFASVEALATLETREGIISAASYLGPGATWETSAEIWTWAVIFSVAWGIVFAISPWQSSRYLMARDEHVVMRSACGASASTYGSQRVSSQESNRVAGSNPASMLPIPDICPESATAPTLAG